MTDLLKYEKDYSVHVYETGPNGKLTLYSLFDFLQDIASDHAVRLGYGRDEMLRRNTFWVLSRIYAEISCMPEWGSTIKIKTWPRGVDKLFALRDYEAWFPDGKPVARATSSWLIVDQTNKRIQRPDNTLSRHNEGLPKDSALPRNAMKLEPVSSGSVKNNNLSVKISDLDINLHTNNVRYLKWVTDSYNLDFILNHYPVSAEINYLAESHYNDIISVVTSEQGENTFCHSILRISDNTELCRMKICWQINNLK